MICTAKPRPVYGSEISRKQVSNAQLTVAVRGIGNAIQASRVADDLLAAVVVRSQRLDLSVGEVLAG